SARRPVPRGRDRSSGGRAPSTAPASGALPSGRARSAWTATRSGDRPPAGRPCARRGPARPRGVRAPPRPIPCRRVPCAHNRRAMDDTILSGDLKLSAHVAVPTPPVPSLGLVLCHGLPNPPRGAVTVGTTYPDLADHIANEAGWIVLTFNFRGTGTSEGDFSARGWLDDLRSAVRSLHSRPEVRGVWIAGFGHGGTFAV